MALKLVRVAQNTEIKFDLVSPVDELAKQIRLEFDFLHEAETMDAVGEHLMVRVLLQLRLTLGPVRVGKGSFQDAGLWLSKLHRQS